MGLCPVAEPAWCSAVVRMPRAALASAAAEQSPARSLAAQAVVTTLIHQRWHDVLRCAALLLLWLSQALGGRECRLLSNLLLKTVRSLKTGVVLCAGVGVEGFMLRFYQEITSFSCLLRACKDDVGLAEVTRLLHVISAGSASHLQCPSREEVTDERHESLKGVVAWFCFNGPPSFFSGV